jgi:hypothetical protein
MFGDAVFTSTDLNRRSAEVLNQARLRPVTISRNNEQFALLRREQAAQLVATAAQALPVAELLGAATAALSGAPAVSPYDWLGEFETDDLRRLCAEVAAALREALAGRTDWDEVDAVLHEWHESALVAASGVLDAALQEPAERQPLEALGQPECENR